MPQHRVLTSICAILALGLTVPMMAAQAETTNGHSAQVQSVPSGGMTMARVLSLYGHPATREPAVGHPPITRWKYAHFIVYFEYNRVIDTVIPGDPPPVYHRSQLITGKPAVRTSSP